MNAGVLAAFFTLSVLLSLAATRLLIPLLIRLRAIDRPNERSSHVLPTLRGAGLALIPIVAIGWIVGAVWTTEPIDLSILWLALGALFLCALSWLDDLRGLPPPLRFGAHVAAVVSVLMIQPSDTVFAQGFLPLWADRLLAGVIWVWFINLFNFMDGIDGISGVETLGITLGVLATVVALGLTGREALAVPAVILAGAAIGFLIFNWHPAKIFLGDSGSIPLGFLLGWLLLQLAASGQWAAAFILPLYYLADATITLVRRALRGEKVWQAHRQHYYQRAVAGGLSHARVSLMVGAANVLLIIFAIGSLYEPWIALFGAGLVTIQMLRLLDRGAPAA